jgi:hypothetical protein
MSHLIECQPIRQDLNEGPGGAIQVLESSARFRTFDFKEPFFTTKNTKVTKLRKVGPSECFAFPSCSSCPSWFASSSEAADREPKLNHRGTEAAASASSVAKAMADEKAMAAKRRRSPVQSLCFSGVTSLRFPSVHFSRFIRVNPAPSVVKIFQVQPPFFKFQGEDALPRRPGLRSA